MRVFTGNGGMVEVSLRMHLERYDVETDERNNIYGFWSRGPRGRIAKVVICQKIKTDLYNLAFGDWNFEVGEVDDLARTNNGDMAKVLATVAYVISIFMQANPKATLIIRGSTPARIRLYQMGIAAYYSEISKDFEVTGLNQGVPEQFVAGKNYEAFSIKNKNKS